MKANKIENLVWSIFFIVGAMFFIMGIFICADIFNTDGKLDLLFLIFPGIGLLFAMIGGIGLLVRMIKKNKEKYLRENGEVVYGNYVETRLNFSYSVNNRHPYNVICKWNNPEDGKTYLFKSKNVWFNPEPKIEDENITTFPIYVDSNNKKKYVVDIDKLTEDIVDLS